MYTSGSGCWSRASAKSRDAALPFPRRAWAACPDQKRGRRCGRFADAGRGSLHGELPLRGVEEHLRANQIDVGLGGLELGGAIEVGEGLRPGAVFAMQLRAPQQERDVRRLQRDLRGQYGNLAFEIFVARRRRSHSS
jgi:hypothetical protein